VTAMWICVSMRGLNLEKLLRIAAGAGIRLQCVRRLDTHALEARLPVSRAGRLRALCDSHGWEMEEIAAARTVRLLRFLRRRWALAAAAPMCVMLVLLASRFLLAVRIEHAGEHAAAVRSVLQSMSVRPGRRLSSLSADRLRSRLEYALPGLVYAGVRLEGSTLVIDCRPSHEGEQAGTGGESTDIIASQDGIVTRIWALSGTPQVAPGDAVRRGQVLIAGEERTGQDTSAPVPAQGQVMARVWARGDAKVSLFSAHTAETGRVRRRVTLQTPWGGRVVREAVPFESQDIEVEIEPVVGIYIPIWRKIELYVENEITKTARNRADVMSEAQGAAEKAAKNNSPINDQVIDKWVDYSMIDNEFVYATVVLEYERDIASRP